MIVLCLIGLAVSAFVPKLLWLIPVCLGLLVGNLFGVFHLGVSTETPQGPIGVGWKIAWAGLVLLALACFAAALLGWRTLEAGVTFTLLAAWGVVLQRHRQLALTSLNASSR